MATDKNAWDAEEAPEIPGGLYRHYKGGLYRVLNVIRDSTNGPTEGRWMVLYTSCERDRMMVRELGQFIGTTIHDGEIVRRFERVPP
jgi:hypothetical protein